MLRYYGSLLARVPALLFSTTDLWLTVLAVLGFLVALFSADLLSAIQKGTAGISPWWAALPIGLRLLYLLLKEEYGRYVALEGQRDGLQMRLSALEARGRPSLTYEPHCDERSLVRLGSHPPRIVLPDSEEGRDAWAAIQNARAVAVTGVGPQSGREMAEVARLHLAHIRIANNPEGRMTEECAARDVRAWVEVFSPDKDAPLLGYPGRWGGATEQPGFRPAFAPAEVQPPVDFPPNGQVHELDIALKHPEDRDVYAFSDESYYTAPQDWRDPRKRLEGDTFHVRVTLRGIGIDSNSEVAWFLLRNGGVGKGIDLVSLGSNRP